MQRRNVLKMDETTVKILLVGDKGLLPKTINTIYAKVEHTWIQVLKDELGVQLNPSSGFFVGTANYIPCNPGTSPGWRGEITETVTEFLSKYEHTEILYLVRLWESKYFLPHSMIANYLQTTQNESTPNFTQAPATSSALAKAPEILISTEDDHVVPPLAEVNFSRSTTVRVTKCQRQHCGKRLKRLRGLSRALFVAKQLVRKAAVFARQINKVEFAEKDNTEGIETEWKPEYVTEQSNKNTAVVEENEEVGENFDDNLSLRTPATPRRNELVGMETEIEVTNELVLSRAKRFSNTFLLRVRNEFKNLQRNGRWDRFVNRSPLAANFLQEFIQE